MWKLLIDKNMKRKDLKDRASVSQNVMARLSKNQAISMDTLEKICTVLECDIGDVVEFIPNDGNYASPTSDNVKGQHDGQYTKTGI